MAYNSYFLTSARKADFAVLLEMGVDFKVSGGSVYLESPQDVEQYLARMPHNKHRCQSIGCVSESYNIVDSALECMSCGTVQA